MATSSGRGPALEKRILILAPEGRNAAVIETVMTANGFQCEVCPDGSSVAAALETGAGVLLLTDGVVHSGDLGPVEQALQRQPLWSELPVLLLAWPEVAEQALAGLGGTKVNVRVVDRPASRLTLVTAVESALRSRERQYEVRGLLQQLRELNENLESRVEQRTRKTRELAARLARAEEQERERIAQILHDRLQQILVAVNIQLQMMQATPEVEPALGRSLAELEEMVDEALETTRNLSVELSPPVLQQAGLPTALRWLQSDMKQSYHLEVALALDADAAGADDELQALLFRATRELLFNVVKHAGTNRARVALAEDEGEIVLTVADSGRGFVLADVEKGGSGHGLPRVRERIALRGGTVEIETAPGAGTTVTIMVPV